MRILAAIFVLTSFAINVQDSHLGVSLQGLSGTPEHRTQLAKELGAAWYRPGIVLLTGDAQCDDCEAARSVGMNISLVVRNSSAAGKPSGPITDAADFQKKLRSVLEREKPAMLVVEDEPEDPKNFSGTPEEYGTELHAACGTAHELKIQCANGGFASVDTANLVIDQRMGADPIDASNIALTTEVLRVHTGSKLNVSVFNKRLGHDKAEQDAIIAATKQYLDKHRAEIDRTRRFVEAINAAGVDRLNFHWYELQPDNVPKVLDSIHELSKLDLMCDEMGQKEERAFEVSEKIRLALENYVWPTIWAGTDGKDGIVGLVDKKGKLRSNAGGFRMEAQK
jgi:hypothetical protein